mmetsp:Transcript_28249/g.55107  ORF Transcript_28249/g.55107 Transcript_28249/m.55107 type:complete len:81 (+) Transcript_28249:17-259(+)
MFQLLAASGGDPPECTFIPPCPKKHYAATWLNAVHYSKARWDVHGYSYDNNTYGSPQMHGDEFNYVYKGSKNGQGAWASG